MKPGRAAVVEMKQRSSSAQFVMNVRTVVNVWNVTAVAAPGEVQNRIAAQIVNVVIVIAIVGRVIVATGCFQKTIPAAIIAADVTTAAIA